MTANVGIAGWVLGTANGVVVQTSNGWAILRPPISGEVRVAQPYGGGYIVAGAGFAFRYKENNWTSLKIDDDFTGAATAGDDAILVGQRSIYVVTKEGTARKIAENPLDGNSIVHRVGDDVIIFSSKASAQVWRDNRLVAARPAYAWGNYREVITVQTQPSGEYFLASSKGLLLIKPGGNEEELLPARRKLLFAKGLVGAFLFGDRIVVATYFGGVEIFSAGSGEEVWSKSAAEIGNICFIQKHGDGILFGTSSGLYVMPNPDRYVTHTLPKGEVLYTDILNGKPVVGLSTATIDIYSGAQIFPEVAVSLLRLHDNSVVRGGIGEVRVGNKTIRIGGRDVVSLAELRNGSVAALQSQRLVLLNSAQGDQIIEIVVPSIANSVTETSESDILVGTSDGVYRFSPGGAVVSRWGSGKYRVKSVGGRVFVFNTSGNILDERGKAVANLPGCEVLDVNRTDSDILILAKTNDQTSWLGVLDSSTNGWYPLDIPIGFTATAFVVMGPRIIIVGADGAIEAIEPPRLSLPDLKLAAIKVGDFAGKRIRRVSPGTSAIGIALPPSRLGAWNNPSYSVKQPSGEWTSATGRSQIEVSTLQWGRNEILVRESWGALERQAPIDVERLWPWWLRWYCLLGYGMVGFLLLWMIVRVRTKGLQRRALQLQTLVDERTRELNRAQKAREDFFSTVSHEIRNPLNGVVGLCEMLHASPAAELGPKNRATVSTLKECADQLRSILDDVLDFTRIDRGKIQLNEEIFELSVAIESAARAIDPALSRCTIVNPRPVVWVRGDKGKLKQIVSNLVSNALKYGRPDHASVKCEFQSTTLSEVRLRILVTNRGPTIAPDELNSIFEGFVRTQDAIDRRIPGSGLGLAVSRRMARALGGDLIATSEKGVTEFALTIGLVPAEPPASSKDEILPQPIRARALAVEDEKYNRMVLGWHLTQLGFEVDWANSGMSAIDRIKTDAYDLILTDIMLPDMTGIVLARQLLQMAPFPKPPIIAVTAYSTPEKIAQAREAGISAFVTKPISREKLHAAILGSHSTESAATLSEGTCDPSFDFAGFKGLSQASQILGEYSEELLEAWAEISLASGPQATDRSSAGKLVHAFRSRVLAVHATDIADQLTLLEEAIVEGRHEHVAKLNTIIGPMVIDLSKAARAAAFEFVTTG